MVSADTECFGLDASIGSLCDLLPTRKFLVVESTETLAAVCCALREQRMQSCLVRLPSGAYCNFDLPSLCTRLIDALCADGLASRVLSVLGSSAVGDVLAVPCGKLHVVRPVSPETRFSEVLALLKGDTGELDAPPEWTQVVVSDGGDGNEVRWIFTCSDVLELLLRCAQPESCPALVTSTRSFLEESFTNTRPHMVSAGDPLQRVLEELRSAGLQGITVMEEGDPERSILERVLGTVSVVDVQYLFLCRPEEAARRLTAPCREFVAFELCQLSSPLITHTGSAPHPFLHIDVDESVGLLASRLFVSKAHCITPCSMALGELHGTVCSRDVVNALFAGGHLKRIRFKACQLGVPLSPRFPAMASPSMMPVCPELDLGGGQPLDETGHKERRVTWADEIIGSDALASVTCFEAEDRSLRARVGPAVLALEDAHDTWATADGNQVGLLKPLRSAEDSSDNDASLGCGAGGRGSTAGALGGLPSHLGGQGGCGGGVSVGGEMSERSIDAYTALESLNSSPNGSRWEQLGHQSIAALGGGPSSPSGGHLGSFLRGGLGNKPPAPTQAGHVSSSSSSRRAASNGVGCGNLGGCVGVGEELQVVLYHHQELVLYDRRSQRAFARHLTEEQANAITWNNRRFCPLCHQRLNPSWAMVVEGYFDMLAGMVPAGVSAFAANQTSEETAARYGLHSIPAGLLNCGYYSRFFVEERKLGSGSFGAVYLCRHVMDQIDLGVYAVKKVALGDDTKRLRQLMREVKALERLRHMNIVDYKHSWLEVSRHSEMCPYVPFLFILMEYCNAGALEGLIWPEEFIRGATDNAAKATVLNDELLWFLFLGICRGLRHLHSRSILHRDLKPSNILLHVDEIRGSEASGLGGTPMPRAMLSDFGTCEIRGEDASAVGGGRVHGGYAVEFMAPECLLGGDSDAPADMWSAGLVLYAMCYGDLPYHSEDPDRCREKVRQHQEPLGPPKTAGGARTHDEAACDLVAALTARDPMSRPTAEAAERISALAARSAAASGKGGRCHESVEDPVEVAAVPLSSPLCRSPLSAAPLMDGPSVMAAQDKRPLHLALPQTSDGRFVPET
eukprot:TRINITY_DN61848_c0_g1_i1.p1 TRINITY_DN61848_c0_g1~~TRINITY_DN61848_c0_g1_i1.p1  ORF type:complete len:1104 (-),score=162.35 TRINITY_DN61848_c0_g1_i1:166-3399(-)